MAKAKSRFVPNSQGFRDALTSPSIQAELNKLAEGAADRANSMMGPKPPTDIYGYRATSRAGRSRSAAYVRTGGYGSRRDNAKNNTLLKSIGG